MVSRYKSDRDGTMCNVETGHETFEDCAYVKHWDYAHLVERLKVIKEAVENAGAGETNQLSLELITGSTALEYQKQDIHVYGQTWVVMFKEKWQAILKAVKNES